MKHLIIRSIIIIMSLAPLASMAQMVTIKEKPSFYLGMRSNITLALGIQPTLSPPSSEDYDYEKLIAMYVNVKPEITYTFALNNKLAIYLKGAMNKSSRTHPLEDLRYYVPEDNEAYYMFERGLPQMTGSTLGAGFSFFRKKKAALAPMGAQFSVGLSRHKYNVTYENVRLVRSSYYDDPFTLDISDRTSQFSYLSVEMAFTTNQPITQNLYYNLGFSSSLNNLLLVQEREKNSGKEDYDLALAIEDIKGLRFRDIAVLKMGLGYMLF